MQDTVPTETHIKPDLKNKLGLCERFFKKIIIVFSIFLLIDIYFIKMLKVNSKICRNYYIY